MRFALPKRFAAAAGLLVALGLVLPALAVPGLVAPAHAQPARSDRLPPIFRDAVPEAGREWSGEPVSMSLRDADLVETLRSFARLGDFNLLIQPGVRGTVTVELKEVPWDQAMSMILRMHGLGMDLTHGTLRIAPVAELERMAREELQWPPIARAAAPRLEVRGELRYLDANLAVALLEHGYLGERGRASARGQVLTVRDEDERLRRIARLISALDVEAVRGDDLSNLRRRARLAWPDTAR